MYYFFKHIIILCIVIFNSISIATEIKYKIISRINAPCRTPMGLAYDGKNFWTVDLRSKKIFSFAPGGQLVKECTLDISHGIGIAYDGNYLRIIDARKKELVLVNPLNCKIVNRFSLKMDQPTGIQCNQNVTYICDSYKNGSITIVDNDNIDELYRLPAPGHNPFGIALENNRLWVSNNINFSVSTVYAFDLQTRTYIGQFRFEEGRGSITGLEQAIGSLWVLSNRTDMIYELEIFL